MNIRGRKILQTEIRLNSESNGADDCSSADLLRAAARQFANKETKEQKEYRNSANPQMQVSRLLDNLENFA